MDGGRGGNGGGSRQMYEITCSNCGRKDSVPFQPRGDRPVLCGDCFRKQRDQRGDDRSSRDFRQSEDSAPDQS
jgi:CxxC-x17-CxxC domain-containing protein